jgi:hypothetical protein
LKPGLYLQYFLGFPSKLGDANLDLPLLDQERVENERCGGELLAPVDEDEDSLGIAWVEKRDYGVEGEGAEPAKKASVGVPVLSGQETENAIPVPELYAGSAPPKEEGSGEDKW